MIYNTTEGEECVVCCVNGAEACGEYTLCGHAIYDISTIEGSKRVGEEFEGTVKDITCPTCREHINYIKSLK